MPRIFINLEVGCLQVNLMSTSAQINQLKYTILYTILYHSMTSIKPINQSINVILGIFRQLSPFQIYQSLAHLTLKM